MLTLVIKREFRLKLPLANIIAKFIAGQLNRKFGENLQWTRAARIELFPHLEYKYPELLKFAIR